VRRNGSELFVQYEVFHITYPRELAFPEIGRLGSAMGLAPIL